MGTQEELSTRSHRSWAFPRESENIPFSSCILSGAYPMVVLSGAYPKVDGRHSLRVISSHLKGEDRSGRSHVWLGYCDDFSIENVARGVTAFFEPRGGEVQIQ